MRVLRNTGQNISPSDDGRLFDQAFTDGLFNSPSITSLGSNLVQIGAMYGILCGRDFTSDAQQITVALSDSGTKTGHIFIRFDTTTADIISIQSVIGSYTPTYQDINTTGTVCEMEIASYTATVLAVTALTPNYPKAQTEINETLAGSIATIETSPATANHSVGEYIVYNGQLYKVTTAITSGSTLTGKISATSVGSEVKALNDSLTTLNTSDYDSLPVSSSFSGTGTIRILRLGKLRVIFGTVKPTNNGVNQTILTLASTDRPAINIQAPFSGYGVTATGELTVQSSGDFVISINAVPANDVKFNITYAVA